MEDQDIAEKEFRDIADEVQRTGEYDLELVLRVKNFKSLAWLRPSQPWESVLSVINEAIREAGDACANVCAPFEKLLEIYGINVPTASVLLAARYPNRFAIIDNKMFEFFRRNDTYGEIKEIFNIDGDDEELRRRLEDIKGKFDETANKRWEEYQEIYREYLKVLSIIRDIKSLPDLRAVEWKIWQSKTQKSA